MIREIRVRDLARQLENGHSYYLIDVRQQWEHALAALPDSILMPLGLLNATAETLDVPKDAPIVVYCHHGVRSRTGARILQEAGFSNVLSLSGGIEAWSEEVDPDVPRY